MTFLLILLFSISFFLRCVNSCGGCQGTAGSSCVYGQSSEVVVELRNETTSRYYPFCIKFGAFSRLRIVEAHNFMGKYSTLKIHYGNQESTKRWYWNQRALSGVSVNAHEVFVSYFSVGIMVDKGRVVDLDSDLAAQNKTNIFEFTKSCEDKNLIDDGKDDQCSWLPSDDSRSRYCVGLEDQRDCGRKMTLSDSSIPRKEKVTVNRGIDRNITTCYTPQTNCTNNTICIQMHTNDSFCHNDTNICCETNLFVNSTTTSELVIDDDAIDIQVWISWVGRDSILQPLTSADMEMERYKYYVFEYNNQYEDILSNEFGRP